MRPRQAAAAAVCGCRAERPRTAVTAPARGGRLERAGLGGRARDAASGTADFSRVVDVDVDGAERDRALLRLRRGETQRRDAANQRDRAQNIRLRSHDMRPSFAAPRKRRAPGEQGPRRRTHERGRRTIRRRIAGGRKLGRTSLMLESWEKHLARPSHRYCVTAANSRSVWYAPPTGWVTALAGLLACGSPPVVQPSQFPSG